LKNPETIRVVDGDESKTVESVRSWWYDGLDLIVLYTDGKTERFAAATIEN
jgi:serine phosphatase RsbU (regulator of sigma subunit)